MIVFLLESLPSYIATASCGVHTSVRYLIGWTEQLALDLYCEPLRLLRGQPCPRQRNEDEASGDDRMDGRVLRISFIETAEYTATSYGKRIPSSHQSHVANARLISAAPCVLT